MRESQVDADLHKGFATANPHFSPVPIWWWSGDELELERMLWQVDQMVAQGVHNTVVLNLAPTGPMHGALSDAPHFLTPEWWGIWDALCRHGEKVGMRFWFYDQIGFSGANLQGRLAVANPDFVGMELHRVTADVEGAGELTLPEAGIYLGAQALPLDGDGCVGAGLEQLALEDGGVQWRGEGRARLTLAYAIRKGFDYHSKVACAALIDVVHGNFERHLGKYFGSAIAGSFQDELPSMPTWSVEFAEEFEARCGYPILPLISALWEDWGTESARVRIDYQRVRAALAEEALFKPIFDWHERHKLTFGFDQQGPSRAAQPISTVEQYADYARTHRWYSAPGSDHWGEAKFHSSLAHSYGRPRTWIESFHSSGWGGTLEETYDWLQPWLLAGANLYNPHAVYYSTKGGQWEWAAPSTCWRQPYWRHYKYFADAVSRLCWAMTRGEHVCDIGVLFPSATVQADLFNDNCGPHARRAHSAYQSLVGQMVWFNSHPGVFKRLRRDYDVLDDDTVAGAAIDGGSLVTRAERYKVLVVPDMWMLETATAEKLVAFAEAGGLLIFVGQVPSVADSAAGDAAIAKLQALVESGKARLVSAADMQGDIEPILADLVPVPFVTASPALLRRDGETNLLLVTAAEAGAATGDAMLPWTAWTYDQDLFSWTRYSGDLRAKGIDFDLRRQRQSASVVLKGKVGSIEQWDPATGRSLPVMTSSHPEGVEVTVDFSLSPVSVLVWSEQGQVAGAATPAGRGDRKVLDSRNWQSEIVPTIDNRFGDFTLPAKPGPLPVQAWTVGYRADNAAGPAAEWNDVRGWQEVPVSFGVRAWSFGPAAPGEAPQPLAAGHKGELGGAGWQPVSYSLSRGIDHDPQHDKTLGPKARIPEPLIRWGAVHQGDVAQVRVALPVEAAGRYTLAIGGNGTKQVWWNGREVEPDQGGYLHMAHVDAFAGLNTLELRLAAHAAGDLEAYWALTTDRDAFIRPEWLVPADGFKAGTILSMRRTVSTRPGDRFEANFATVGMVALLVNGREVGIQGAFDPYAQWRSPRVIKYDMADVVVPGDNVVEARFTDDGGTLGLLFDGVVTDQAGAIRETIVSDRSWRASRENTEVELTYGSSQVQDARFYLLRPRPHPLPRTGWLNDDQPEAGVLDLLPEPYPGLPKQAQWFSIAVPPGAARAHLPIARAQISAFMDGQQLALDGTSIVLPTSAAAGALLLLRADVTDGRYGGAVFDGPVEFETEAGRIDLGSWASQGLGFYSGGVAYSRSIEVHDPSAWTELDLGHVRGTAEVEVNGVAAGVRVWSPYRFDIAGKLRAGENTVTIRVFNTLAPYLKGASSTRAIFRGQDVSGLFGPVSLCG